MIEVVGLVKDFNDFRAVDNISFSVEPGQVFAILGPNGAGKTTTVRMLTCILPPTAGYAMVAGYNILHQPEMVRASVGVLTEQHGLYERMNALEYLDFFGRIYEMPAALRRQRSYELMERFGLGADIKRRVAEYSKGMKQKLALVRAMLHNPPVLMLDEPTSAMDPQSAKLVRDAMLELKQDHRTIILTTHNLPEAQLLADIIGVIRHGRLIAHGSFAELSYRFVGDPLMELRTAAPMNGTQALLREMVTVVDQGDNWLRYRTPDPQRDNPQILTTLMQHHVPVVTLSEIQHSLESIYLQIVTEDEGETTRQEAI